ncbi:hypothetical protein RCL1_008027 [Eukaryota sp. TZLM3-RCL]
MISNLSLVANSYGHQYYNNIIDRSLSTKEIPLLTSLKHPNLIRYYHTDDQKAKEIVFDSCEFGLFSDLDVSKLDLSCHDLWSIRNQILQALKYLASQGLYHSGLNVSNVLVCSLYPISIKLSLFSNSQVLVSPVNTEIPIQEFWKQKMNEHEELCFDDLIRSTVKSVFPYLIIDKNIVFTNRNTLERNDLESLKALICSIESKTMFKSDQCIGDFSTINTNLSHFFKSFKSQEQKTLFISKTLLFHVFSQGILKFKRPLLSFFIVNSQLESRKNLFSHCASQLISISVNFRNEFFRAFEFVCRSRGHCLRIGIVFSAFNPIISSRCTCASQLSTPSVVYLNWLKKFPITSIFTTTLSFDTGILDTEKVTQLKLTFFNEQLSLITLFPNLSCFCLSHSSVVHDYSLLAACRNLCSISITRCSAFDLTPLSNIEQLTSFSLCEVDITDFSPLSTSIRLTKMSLDDCNFTNLSVLSPLQELVELTLNGNKITDIAPLSSLKNLRILSLFKNKLNDLSPLSGLRFIEELVLSNNEITDIYPLSSLKNLRILPLFKNFVSDLSPLSGLQFLEKLVLSNNKITDLSSLTSVKNLIDLSLNFNRITDLRPLSSLFKLERLTLTNTLVLDLWPLKNLIKLSTLDVTKTLLRIEHQRELTNSTDIRALINLFEHGVFGLDFSNYNDIVNMRLYSHRSKLKSLNLSNQLVENVSEICKFTDLETLDLSKARLDGKIISDISFLSSCIKLKSLILDGSQVTDLSPLSLLSNNLKSLSLNNSLFSNLSQLSLFKQLEYLSLNGNNIVDISPLSSLENLTNLSLHTTQVSDVSSLQNLSKLSFLDIRKTLLPQEYQRVFGLSRVQEFLKYFTGQLVDSSINHSTKKRTCSSELSLKKINN